MNNETAAEKVDEKLEQVSANGEAEQPKEPAPQSNGVDAQAEPQEPAAAEAEELKPERPATPEPTPAEPAEKEAPAVEKKENAPPAKAVPKTWATIASKSGASAPVPPAIPVAPPKPAPVASSPKPAAAPAPAATETIPSQPPSNDGSGWQTAGENKKSQARTAEEGNVLAYIKNVNDKVDASLLKQTLSRFGKLRYFDVSRPKVCFFFINPTALFFF